VKTYPALTVRIDDADRLAAVVDDYSPTAIEPREHDARVFFATAVDRDNAQRALASHFDVAAIDVPDEDWARRSQENLAPVTVGRITVSPFPQSPSPPVPKSPAPSTQPLAITIVPSMGFGTGHHVTTRLCLEALQTIDLRDRTVLDVGTGSGILAIAADRLGAGRALGIDSDADAIQSARENLPLNPQATHVIFDVADLTGAALPEADVVTANLTGALLVRSAARIAAAVRHGGVAILSGLLAHERDEVVAAFSPLTVVWEHEDEGWVGLAVKKW